MTTRSDIKMKLNKILRDEIEKKKIIKKMRTTSDIKTLSN
jgi:hypothetical protein